MCRLVDGRWRSSIGASSTGRNELECTYQTSTNKERAQKYLFALTPGRVLEVFDSIRIQTLYCRPTPHRTPSCIWSYLRGGDEYNHFASALEILEKEEGREMRWSKEAVKIGIGDWLVWNFESTQASSRPRQSRTCSRVSGVWLLEEMNSRRVWFLNGEW